MAIDICIRFGRRVRQLRRERGWRQVDLAQHAGITENYVSDVELGKKEVCIRTIEALSLAFGVRTAELMEETSKR